MIRYALRCDRAHDFESWFQSAAAFDALAAGGMLSCPSCGSARVEKTLMAPQVQPARKRAAAREAAAQDGPVPEAAVPAAGPLSGGPRSALEAAMADLRRKVEEGSDYVGMNFSAEARAIHEGRAPERAIWGEARVDEARKLLEDGIPVAPLPFRPKSKTN